MDETKYCMTSSPSALLFYFSLPLCSRPEFFFVCGGVQYVDGNSVGNGEVRFSVGGSIIFTVLQLLLMILVFIVTQALLFMLEYV